MTCACALLRLAGEVIIDNPSSRLLRGCGVWWFRDYGPTGS